MTQHLSLSNVSHGYGGGLLLAQVDLVITHGEGVALVGENGAGKSTMLRLRSGREEPDDGSISIHGRVGYLAQTLDHAPSDLVGADLRHRSG